MHERKARIVTGFVLAGLTGVLTIPLVYGLANDSATFIGTDLGFARAGAVPFIGWIAAAVVAVGYVIGTMTLLPPVRREAFRWSGLKAIAIVTAFVSGVVEELIFRRLLMDAGAGAGLGVGTQIIFSAVAFGVAHSAWGLFAGDVRIVMPTVLSTTLLGAALAGVYVLSDRVLLPAAIAHVVINLVIEPGLMLSAVSAAWRRPGTSERRPSTTR